MVGQTLSHYRILEQIGAGGMGVVYRASDERLERDVAIKVLPVGTLADESARQRFRKEALTLSKLNHPNVATVHDFDSQGGVDFLVTEYISGITLDAKVAAGALPEQEVIRLGMQLSEGLKAAHQQNIVHRDLKPANLRLTPDGRLKILDFGLAQLMPHASDLGITATWTQSHEVTGTLPYMAPEQLRGGVADARSDIWAAGAVLYEMATAHRPFEEKFASALAADIIHKAPPAPRSVKSGLSSKLETVILKCLEKEPVNRYQSALELQEDLERLGSGVTPLVARRRPWRVIVTTAIVIAGLCVGTFFYSRRGHRLTELDTIVLADFANTTGDTVFDDALKQGLRVQLEQSPFLNVVSDQKVNEELRLMGRQQNERLTPDLTREVCQRLGSKAVLAGSVSRLGAHYVVGLNALNCHTGDSLGSEQVEADSQEHVLKALRESATKMRRDLGESLKSIQRFDAPLEQVSTRSLQALRAYSLGMKTLDTKGGTAAIPFLQRAVELDPKFAMAYARLGFLSVENYRKAYELRDKVTEWERLYIEGHYYRNVTGEQDKAASVWEVMQQTYPRAVEPYSNLAGFYTHLGNYEKALKEAHEALRLDPDDQDNYGTVANLSMCLDRLDEAEAAFKQAEERHLESEGLLEGRYTLDFLRGDAEGMARVAASAADKPFLAFALQGSTEAYYGRLRKARELSRRAVESAKQNGAVERAAGLQAALGFKEVYLGDMQHARADVDTALRMAANQDVQLVASLVLALAGDTEHAEKLAAEVNKSFPLDTEVQRFYLPTTRAVVALSRKNPAKAVELLRLMSSHDLGAPGLVPIYERGRAYLMLHDGSAAVTEFQKVIDHPGIVQAYPVGALAHLGVARAYALQGDTTKSRAAYQDFLTLWKNADPDIPILQQAKAEYAKLQ
jgi:serine/threonine protein kinase/tetratricopeptide (TPR) repeat protein